MKFSTVRHSKLQQILTMLLIGIVGLNTIMPVSVLQASPKHRSGKIRFKLPPLPPGDPPGGRRRGGAGRDNCPAVEIPLTVFIPATTRERNSKSIEDIWGLTVAEKPIFWVYNPYEQGDRYRATFVIRKRNKHGESIGAIPIKLPVRPGVFKIAPLAKLPGLSVNQRYYWELAIDCSAKVNTVPLKVHGVVQRVELPTATLQQIQAAATTVEKAQYYAENGIWFEALDLIGEGRQTTPKDPLLEESWQDLLGAVGLDAAQFEMKPSEI